MSLTYSCWMPPTSHPAAITTEQKLWMYRAVMSALALRLGVPLCSPSPLHFITASLLCFSASRKCTSPTQPQSAISFCNISTCPHMLAFHFTSRGLRKATVRFELFPWKFWAHWLCTLTSEKCRAGRYEEMLKANTKINVSERKDQTATNGWDVEKWPIETNKQMGLACYFANIFLKSSAWYFLSLLKVEKKIEPLIERDLRP